jgi:phosphoglycolate phosphatase
VVSNKFDGAVKGLCRRYFGDTIPVAIGESQGVARKPAPDTVLRALAELGAGTAGAVYVGDSDVDIQTARNSGLPCLSVSWGFRDRAFLTAHGAQRIVDTTAELEALLTGREA